MRANIIVPSFLYIFFEPLNIFTTDSLSLSAIGLYSLNVTAAVKPDSTKKRYEIILFIKS